MYKITLKRPQDPLVDLGSKGKTNWVPAELYVFTAAAFAP